MENSNRSRAGEGPMTELNVFSVEMASPPALPTNLNLPFQPLDYQELKSAVDSYSVNGPHGDMSTWDVSRITNMSQLFSEKVNFNETYLLGT